MKKMLVLISAAVALSACSSPEQLLAADRATCERIGFAPESGEFKNCVLELQSARLAAGKHHRRW